MKILIATILTFLPLISHALELEGIFTQGGFMVGKTVPQAKVSFGKYKIEAASDGTFILPITRNQKNADLSIMLMEGIEEKHPISIAERTYNVQKINGVPKRKVTPKAEDLKQIRSDKKQILAARAIFKKLPFFKQTPIQPTQGRISGVYGSKRVFNGKERSWHKGLDIAAPTGTPVIAPTDGTIRLALEDSFFNGNLIVLDHGHQLMSIYAHLDSMNVKAGDKVKQGDLIGHVGTTGRSTGPHLHFGLYWRNIALDPKLWLDQKLVKIGKKTNKDDS